MADIFKPRIIDFEDKHQLYIQATDIIATTIEDVIGDYNTCRIALCGGGTPLPIYQKLAQQPHLHWDHIELYQTDERHTTDTELLNQTHIKEALNPVLPYCKEVYFINTSLPINESISHYNDIIDELEEPLFDIVMLGIGYDGHFASLFPQGDFKHSDQRTVSTTAPSYMDVSQRISLTLETILDSREIMIFLTGQEKSNVLVDMLENDLNPQDFPAKFLLAHPKVTIFQSI